MGKHRFRYVPVLGRRCIQVIALCTVAVFPSPVELFSHGDITLALGGLFPQGEVGEVLDPRPVLALRFTTPYYGSWDAHGDLQYALLGGDGAARDVHYVKTGVGLSYGPDCGYLPHAGIGIANNFIRSTAQGSDELMLLDHNESEFGVYPFLFWNIPLQNRYTLYAGGEWNVIFSGPHYTLILKTYIGMCWNWW